jgi:hypothetical protein
MEHLRRRVDPSAQRGNLGLTMTTTDLDITQLTLEIADEIAFDVKVTGDGRVDGVYDAAQSVIILLHRRGLLRKT